MRQLQEMIWYLTETLTLNLNQKIHSEIQNVLAETERLTYLPSNTLLDLDVAAHRAYVNDLLLQTSELVKSEAIHFQGKGKKRHKNIGRGADLIGADFRDADISGADLTDSIFLTQAQLNATKGDIHTKITARLTRPAHWKN